MTHYLFSRPLSPVIPCYRISPAARLPAPLRGLGSLDFERPADLLILENVWGLSASQTLHLVATNTKRYNMF